MICVPVHLATRQPPSGTAPPTWASQHNTSPPAPRENPRAGGLGARGNYFLPWLSRADAATCVIADQVRFPRPPGGRIGHLWPLLRSLGRPREGPELISAVSRATAGRHPLRRDAARSSATDSQPRRRVRQPLGRAHASPHPYRPHHATGAVDQTSPQPPKSHQKPQCVFSSIYQGRKKEIGAYTSVHTSPGCHPQLAVTIPVLHYREATPTISAPLLISRTASQLWPGPAPNVQ